VALRLFVRIIKALQICPLYIPCPDALDPPPLFWGLAFLRLEETILGVLNFRLFIDTSIQSPIYANLDLFKIFIHFTV
jgi:hypothetical protein